MPAAKPVLTPASARCLAADLGFPGHTEIPLDCVGLEHEWLTVRIDDPTQPASLTDVEAAIAGITLPGASRITFEPGGQIELSGPPLPRLDACSAFACDSAELGTALAHDGIGIVALGLEPGPRRARVVHNARYDAMEAHYDARGPAGRTMMRSTAAFQVNIGLGDAADARWEAAHALGPVLAAAFANSPFGDARPSGWRSTRLWVWSAIGKARGLDRLGAGDCRDAWAEYALTAPLMLVRASDDECTPVLPMFTFGDWVEHGHELGWPTPEDLAYHLTTVFPPVRPRGWLELRMFDAIPDPWRRVAAAVTAVLVAAWAADCRLREVVRPVARAWNRAARDALGDPELAVAAARCFEIARERLHGAGADGHTIAATDEYIERYVARRRCPADDLLDRWRTSGAVLPAPENLPQPALV